MEESDDDLEYDRRAVGLITRMENLLERIDTPRFGHFVGILSALENHVEESDGVPAVVRHLGDAVLALAKVHRIDEKSTLKLTQLLGELHDHVADLIARRA